MKTITLHLLIFSMILNLVFCAISLGSMYDKDVVKQKDFKTDENFLSKSSVNADIKEEKIETNKILSEHFFNDIFINQISNKVIENLYLKSLRSSSQGAHLLNITEHSLNSGLLLAQRGFPINLSIKNDSKISLPISIDTASLSLIIPELSTNYPKNTNMSLTVYEDNKSCAAPVITMAIDGIYLDFDVGLKLSVFNSETGDYNEILDVTISSEIKATIFTQENKLNIFLMKVDIEELSLKNNVLSLDKDTLKIKFLGFFSLLIDQTRKMLTNIDVLKILNDLTGKETFTTLEIMANVGSLILKIN